jgi:hypothetical protein
MMGLIRAPTRRVTQADAGADVEDAVAATANDDDDTTRAAKKAAEAEVRGSIVSIQILS